MTVLDIPHADSPLEVVAIPPLRAGDRLTRAEFERRYEAMPHVNKAELIEGVVYIPSPVSHVGHGRPHFQAVTWLGVYEAATPGVIGGDNSTLRLDLDNEPQPDAFLLVDPQRGGQARISEDGYIEGAPELVFEVAYSSANYDLHDKLRAYERNGVREYVVWRTWDHGIDWFSWMDGRFVRLQPGDDRIYRSLTFPGLWLAVPLVLRRDLAGALACLQQGLATKEHADFVRSLAVAR